MSCSTVSVLAPNGRRQTVKCTANTTIMQIIEEVCRKQGFKPEDYDIKHHNKVLDTTISFRFSGLPNNAQLELATATKARTDSEVILGL
nr:PREDICTED: tether containing UBX domain for GLUT4 [Tribolium castaneum]|eukprot:XP_008190607.1 PREDICTED: tether containing UBX domain for GLUT4 [Tribolium castaneum]